MTKEISDAIAVLVTAGLGYALNLLRQWVNSHTTPRQFAAVQALAQQAVSASEQALKSIEGAKGSDKFALASDALQAGAKRVGLKLTADEVQSFINAAVAEYKVQNAYLSAGPQ